MSHRKLVKVARSRTQVPISAQHRREQRRIAAAFAEIDFALPGSVETRRTRCGKTNCRCHADPPQLHGPYNVWTRKVKAKTVTKVLTEDQLGDYQPWFDNAKKLRALLTELQELTLRIVEEDDRKRRS